jgi:FtsP/CotA-like multicopper oxidase with cupredoxin domain
MNNLSGSAKNKLGRREVLKLGVTVGTVGVLAAGYPFLNDASASSNLHGSVNSPKNHEGIGHGGYSGTMGDVDLSRFDPTEFLTAFDRGVKSTSITGATTREWDIVAIDKEIEIAPGVFFPAWTYNGQVPGPTFRCREGDLLRFHFSNSSNHPHTIHFHGFHPPSMDGIEPIIQP